MSSSDRANEKIRKNRDDIEDSLDRMAERNERLARITRSPSYIRGKTEECRGQLERTLVELDSLGDRGTRGTVIFDLYRRVYGGPALPLLPARPNPPRPALPAEPLEDGEWGRLEDATYDWRQAWGDCRDYSIMAGARWYQKVGRFFVKTLGYGVGRALIGYGLRTAYRGIGYQRARQKLNKAEKKRAFCEGEAARLREAVNLGEGTLRGRYRN